MEESEEVTIWGYMQHRELLMLSDSIVIRCEKFKEIRRMLLGEKWYPVYCSSLMMMMMTMMTMMAGMDDQMGD